VSPMIVGISGRDIGVYPSVTYSLGICNGMYGLSAACDVLWNVPVIVFEFAGILSRLLGGGGQLVCFLGGGEGRIGGLVDCMCFSTEAGTPTHINLPARFDCQEDLPMGRGTVGAEGEPYLRQIAPTNQCLVCVRIPLWGPTSLLILHFTSLWPED